MRIHGLKLSVLPQKLKPLYGAGKHSKDFTCRIFGIDCSWPLDRKGAAPFRVDLCGFPLHLLAPQWTLLCFFALPPAFPAAPLYYLGIGFPGRLFSVGLSGSLVPSDPSCFFSYPKAQTPSSTCELCCPGMIWKKESVWLQDECGLRSGVCLWKGSWWARGCGSWNKGPVVVLGVAVLSLCVMHPPVVLQCGFHP